MLGKLSIYLFLLLIIPDVYIYKLYITRSTGGSPFGWLWFSFRAPSVHTRLDSTILQGCAGHTKPHSVRSQSPTWSSSCRKRSSWFARCSIYR